MVAAKVDARVLVHATESVERVRDALLFALGLHGQVEAASRVHTQTTQGHHGNPIHMMTVRLGKPADVTALLSALGPVAGKLEQELEARWDDTASVLPFRLDKQEAVQHRIALTRSGDAIQVELRLERRPGTDPMDALRRLLQAHPTKA